MSRIIELISEHSNYIILTLGVILIGSVFTFIVNFAAKNLKFAKYIPGLLLVFVGIFSLFLVINNLFDPESLDNLIIFVIGVSSGLISLIFALIIGIAGSDRNRYGKKQRKK
ncbi:MAG: cytochrome C biosynthesis protein [Tissierellia bacterium]|nr:cytochrome C biosynthesis protein [Tissierellia bacterium]